MATALEKISGMGGFIYAGTGAYTGTYESLVINTDAVFTVFKINDVDVMTSKGLGSKTISAGMYLPAGPEFKITAFTLASGSVIAYL